MVNHVFSEHECSQYYCYICKKPSTGPTNESLSTSLESHMKSLHGGKDPFRCEACLKTFETYQFLLKHCMLEKHIQPKTCTACCQTFTSMLSSKGHFQTYHLNGNYSCPNCRACFTDEKYLEGE